MEITRSVPLEHYAVFMRKGAIVPMQPHKLTSAQGPQDNRIINIWPGANGEFRLYEDAGRGFAYRDGAYRWTPIPTQTSANGACHTVTITAAQGQNFPGALQSRSWQLRFSDDEQPQQVTVNGNTLTGWTYDTTHQTVTVSTGKRSSQSPIVVKLNTGNCS